MEKTDNFLNNQKYIWSEKVKRKVYNSSIYNKKYNLIWFKLIIIITGLIFSIILIILIEVIYKRNFKILYIIFWIYIWIFIINKIGSILRMRKYIIYITPRVYDTNILDYMRNMSGFKKNKALPYIALVISNLDK